jgi:hypothetical protein
VVPGDQIFDCSSAFFSVDAMLNLHAIRLASPEALCLETAFRHAENSLKVDRAIADALLRDGSIAIATKARRPLRPSADPRTAELAFPEGHPLVT